MINVWYLSDFILQDSANSRIGRKKFFPEITSTWERYAFALTAFALAWVLHSILHRYSGRASHSFLLGFAAVIASAIFAGFSPGILATALVLAWRMVLLRKSGRLYDATEILSCLIFVSECVFLCICGARMRRAMNQASYSEAWHRSLVETSIEGIWVINSEGVITWANPRIAEILGVNPVELPGRKMEDFVFPCDRSVERIRFENRRLGLKEQFDRRLRRGDGSEAWLLTCSSTLPDALGGESAVLSMMSDITERKLAETALRRSEERFRGLFENVLEGVYQTTPDGRILAANPMLLRMLGFSNEAELNRVIANDFYTDPAIRTRLTARLEDEGSFQNVEYDLRRRDGKIITVQENARAVRDQDGRVLYYEGTLADITEHRENESQLHHAHKMEALRRFAGGIALDFEKILAAISEHAKSIAEQLPATHHARSCAQKIQQGVESALSLSRQLVLFGQSRSGMQAARGGPSSDSTSAPNVSEVTPTSR